VEALRAREVLERFLERLARLSGDVEGDAIGHAPEGAHHAGNDGDTRGRRKATPLALSGARLREDAGELGRLGEVEGEERIHGRDSTPAGPSGR